MKNLSSKIKLYIKKLKKPETVQDAILVATSLFAGAAVIIKFLFLLIDAGYKHYFSISTKWDGIILLNYLSQIFFFLGFGILCLIINYLFYSALINGKKVVLRFLFIFISVPSVIYVISYGHTIQNSIKMFLLFDLCFFSIFGEIGVVLGLSSRKSIKEIKFTKFENWIYKKIKRINQFTYEVIIMILLIILLFIFYYLGICFASSTRKFKIIDDKQYVILSENDSCYLVSPYKKYDINDICISTKEQLIITKENRKTIIYTFNKVTIE